MFLRPSSYSKLMQVLRCPSSGSWCDAGPWTVPTVVGEIEELLILLQKLKIRVPDECFLSQLNFNPPNTIFPEEVWRFKCKTYSAVNASKLFKR